MTDIASKLRPFVLDVPDFPKSGILFRDITPLLANHDAFSTLVDSLATRYRGLGITQVVSVESRGFLFGAPLAYALGAGLTLVRKPGKLPRETLEQSYELEYGTDKLQIHKSSLNAADNVIIVDDVLATGGTAEATARLVEQTGATIAELAFVIELDFLAGAKRLEPRKVYSLIHY